MPKTRHKTTRQTPDPGAPLNHNFPIGELEDWLRSQLPVPGAHNALLQAMEPAVLAGGKRFRSILALASTRLLGHQDQSAFPLAGAVEMIHAYSLVHDDLPAMDDAELRRGQPTLHRQVGEAMAILAGDALLTDAFRILVMADAPADRLVAEVAHLARAAGTAGMVSGQVGDILDLPGADNVETVRAIHRGKTGALIEWSLMAPLRLWGDGQLDRDVAEYARHLGVLFQVRDDLLDIDPDAEQDKDRSADEGKSTYARLLGSDGARAAAAGELDACRQAASRLPDPHAAVFTEIADWTIGRTH